MLKIFICGIRITESWKNTLLTNVNLLIMEVRHSKIFQVYIPSYLDDYMWLMNLWKFNSTHNIQIKFPKYVKIQEQIEHDNIPM